MKQIGLLRCPVRNSPEACVVHLGAKRKLLAWVCPLGGTPERQRACQQCRAAPQRWRLALSAEFNAEKTPSVVEQRASSRVVCVRGQTESSAEAPRAASRARTWQWDHRPNIYFGSAEEMNLICGGLASSFTLTHLDFKFSCLKKIHWSGRSHNAPVHLGWDCLTGVQNTQSIKTNHLLKRQKRWL